MILAEDFDINLKCYHKYFTYWWQRFWRYEGCSEAIEAAILDTPLEYFEVPNEDRFLDLAFRLEDILKTFRIDGKAYIDTTDSGYSISFKTDEDKYIGHLFLNKKE